MLGRLREARRRVDSMNRFGVVMNLNRILLSRPIGMDFGSVSYGARARSSRCQSSGSTVISLPAKAVCGLNSVLGVVDISNSTTRRQNP